MRVLYIHNVGLDSESANLVQVRAMCKAMAGLGCEVELSLPFNSSSDGGVVKTSDGFQISFRHTTKPVSRIVKYLSGGKIRKAIENSRPDLVYLRNPLLLKQVEGCGVRVILELHNSVLHQGSSYLDHFWKFHLIKSSADCHIHKIVCISDALMKYWAGLGISSKKLITAHDGVDQYMFLDSMSKPIAREALNLPLDPVIVSYIGRLYEDRKIEYIIELARSFKDLHFVVVGGPDYQADKYRELAKHRGLSNIVFTGQILHRDTPAYMFASDILLALWSAEVPTINYCSPLKVFEYMASGRTILAHGFPTIKEVLQHDINAIIVEPESLDDLQMKLQYALDRDVSSLGENARRSVFEHYTWDKRAQYILESLV